MISTVPYHKQFVIGKIWSKSGYRSEFYQYLSFTKESPQSEIESEMLEEHRDNIRSRVFKAKCHALRAYRTALDSLYGEYEQNADLVNQYNAAYNSHLDSFILGLCEPPALEQPKAPYNDDKKPDLVLAIIHGFSDYFPMVGYTGEDANLDFECPCNCNSGRAVIWRSNVRGYSPIFCRDDKCGPGFHHTSLTSLMSHLHRHDTPLHSAAFAYVSYMSGDRLPDFGYRFEDHGLPPKEQNAMLSESLELSAYIRRQEQQIEAQLHNARTEEDARVRREAEEFARKKMAIQIQTATREAQLIQRRRSMNDAQRQGVISEPVGKSGTDPKSQTDLNPIIDRKINKRSAASLEDTATAATTAKIDLPVAHVFSSYSV
jgi:hypothetical protein